jgi:hypothetical protein
LYPLLLLPVWQWFYSGTIDVLWLAILIVSTAAIHFWMLLESKAAVIKGQAQAQIVPPWPDTKVAKLGWKVARMLIVWLW